MKIYNTDGSLLMDIQTLSRHENELEFTGTVMGAMPVKGRLSPEEARSVFSLIKGRGLWGFLITFIFRKTR